MAAPVRVAVSRLRPESIDPAQWCVIWDISGSGLCVVTSSKFDLGEETAVTFSVRDVVWTGLMEVVHCTQTLNGYKIGLRALEPDEAPAPGTTIDVPHSVQTVREITAFRRSSAEQEWIGMAKREIAQAMTSYRRARRTFGVFGVSINKRIRQMIDELPPPAGERGAESQRKHRRLGTKIETFVVFSAYGDWRRLPAAFVDVSLGGLGLLVPHDLVTSQAEREMAGDWFVYSGMPIMVGMQTESETLWIPAEIVRVEEPSQDIVRAGVQFATPRAMEFFGAR